MEFSELQTEITLGYLEDVRLSGSCAVVIGSCNHRTHFSGKFVFLHSRNSDVNLIELGDAAVKQDDRALLCPFSGLALTACCYELTMASMCLQHFEDFL